jgi:hypothetical protein
MWHAACLKRREILEVFIGRTRENVDEGGMIILK